MAFRPSGICHQRVSVMQVRVEAQLSKSKKVTSGPVIWTAAEGPTFTGTAGGPKDARNHSSTLELSEFQTNPGDHWARTTWEKKWVLVVLIVPDLQESGLQARRFVIHCNDTKTYQAFVSEPRRYSS
jgi:hypothetical protein